VSAEKGEQLIDKSQVFTMDDFDYEEVVVPEWKWMRVLVRGLSMAEYDSIREAKTTEGENLTEEAARLLTHVIVHPERKTPLFDESDAERFLTRSHKPALRLFNVALRLSVASPEALEAAGKGSAPTLNGASSSSSAAPSGSPTLDS
jgi:hypothetical protein